MAEKDSEHCVYVGGLSCHVTEDKLDEVFSRFGKVTDIKIMRPRGFGFVTFSDKSNMEEAIRGLNGCIIGGKEITVNTARPRTSGDDQDRAQGGGESYFRHNRCFNCYQPGHFLRECPELARGGGGRREYCTDSESNGDDRDSKYVPLDEIKKMVESQIEAQLDAKVVEKVASMGSHYEQCQRKMVQSEIEMQVKLKVVEQVGKTLRKMVQSQVETLLQARVAEQVAKQVAEVSHNEKTQREAVQSQVEAQIEARVKEKLSERIGQYEKLQGKMVQSYIEAQVQARVAEQVAKQVAEKVPHYEKVQREMIQSQVEAQLEARVAEKVTKQVAEKVSEYEKTQREMVEKMESMQNLLMLGGLLSLLPKTRSSRSS